MSLGNVPCSCYLQLPKIRPGLSAVGSHAVVPESKDDGKEESGRTSSSEEECQRLQNRKCPEARTEHQDPHVMQSNANALKNRVLQTPSLQFKLSVCSATAYPERRLKAAEIKVRTYVRVRTEYIRKQENMGF